MKDNLEPLLHNALFTLDVCHVVEKLWSVGRRFHKEGSEELKAWVEDLKTLVYGGRAAELVERLHGYCRQVPFHGPGTKSPRAALTGLTRYRKPGLAMSL